MSADSVWETYITQSLIGSRTIDKGAMFNLADNKFSAISPGFAITADEMRAIASSFIDKGDASGVKEVQKNGIKVEGKKYLVLLADENSIYAKKAKEGIVVAKTVRMIIIAHYPETDEPKAATQTVEALAHYLRNTNW